MTNRKEGFGSPPPGQEQDSVHQQEYAGIVQGVRQYLRKQEHFEEHCRKKGILAADRKTAPEMHIDLKLFKESIAPEKRRFFDPLYYAWKIVMYDRLTPGTQDERVAARKIAEAATIYDPHHLDPTIKFTSRQQVLLFDALTEVVGIPHKKGQTEIPIPEKYRDYDRWISSSEYKERVARTQADRKR